MYTPELSETKVSTTSWVKENDLRVHFWGRNTAIKHLRR